eukprot:scaffold1169_cov120-Cylindrotheca_fusiformis.AAC.32
MGHFNSRRDSLGCDAMCLGSMTSARSTLSLLGATLVGKLSDSKSIEGRIGGARKFCLMLGILASALEVLIAWQANSIAAMWVSLIPSALLNQNFTVLKALFGDYQHHSNDDDSAESAKQAGRVGKLGMAAGLAFMIGPLASSILLTTYNRAALFAGFCLASAFLFILLLPQPPTRQEEEEKSSKPTETKPQSNSIWYSRIVPDFVPAARTPPAIFIMTVRVCMSLAFHIFQTIWTVALRERFHFGPTEYGQYFGFIGFSFAMSQGFLAKFFIQKFGSTIQGRGRLLLLCSLILGGGRLFVYQTTNLAIVYPTFGAIITALGVVNTIFTADTSKIASPHELGGLFGVLASVESLAGIIGPVLGGAFSKIHPEHGPMLAVLILYGFVFASVFLGYERIVGRRAAPDAKKNT